MKMAQIQLTLIDQTGNKFPVKVPDDKPINSIVSSIVSKAKLPATGPDSAPLTYELHSKQPPKKLDGKLTFKDEGVKNEDELRIVSQSVAAFKL